MQIIYFSHGGGPLPILGDPEHKAMIDFMKALPGQIKKPDAILVISAHWEEEKPTLLGAKNPQMFYDYYGFAPEAYQIQYPAPGNPELAEQIVKLLGKNNIEAKIDTERGFDHGLFIPLKMMYPEANIPAIQLSLISGLNAQKHINLGKAMRDLKDKNILVIGSGFSFHNMLAFMQEDHNSQNIKNNTFQDWLIKIITSDLPEEGREDALISWENAPNARYCHPREEHLLPLHVCQGLAGKPGKLIFDDKIFGFRSVAFLW